MILKALAEYYERMLADPDYDIAPPGFEKKALPYVLVIDKKGRFINFRDTRTGAGKERIAREFLVPQGEKKAAGIKANLLWDNPQYVLGFPKSASEKDKQRADDSFTAFKERINEVFGEDFIDEGLTAVKAFLKEKDFSNIFQHEAWVDIRDNNAQYLVFA